MAHRVAKALQDLKGTKVLRVTKVTRVRRVSLEIKDKKERLVSKDRRAHKV